jgi:hypothetical protein
MARSDMLRTAFCHNTQTALKLKCSKYRVGNEEKNCPYSIAVELDKLLSYKE